MAAERPGEDALIARHFAPLAGEGAFGLRDDAATLVCGSDEEIVVTKDALVAGVHFFAGDPAEAIARKALRVNLSDLAAKGARPAGFLLALALPPDWTEDWLARFAAGLGADAGAFACPLLGGDTVRTPGPLTLSITALGRTRRGAMVKRFTAAPGDALFVSGTIGDAALGLRLRQGAEAPGLPAADRAFLLDRYLLPRPRLELAPALAAHARAAMDISDGLVGDAAKMLAAAGAGGEISLDRVPLSPAASAAIEALPALREAALTGGDDYEILAAVAPEGARAFAAAAAAAGVPATRVGAVRASPGLVLREADGRPARFSGASFQHF